MLTDIRRKAAAGLILAALVTGPAFADKPDGAGGGKPERVEGGTRISRRWAPRYGCA